MEGKDFVHEGRANWSKKQSLSFVRRQLCGQRLGVSRVTGTCIGAEGCLSVGIDCVNKTSELNGKRKKDKRK